MSRCTLISIPMLAVCLTGCSASLADRTRSAEMAVPDEPVTIEEVSKEMGPMPMSPAPLKDMAVMEMLFRYVIRRYADEQIKVWFINCVDGEDPPPNFLKRFSDMPVPVKGVSAAVKPWIRGVRDSETGEQGAIAWARIIRWPDESTAEVEFSCYRHGLAAEGMTMMIRYESGRWKTKGAPYNIWVS